METKYGSTANEKFDVWQDFLDNKRKAKLLKILRDSPAIEVAEFLALQKSPEVILGIILQLPNEFCADIFIEFDNDFQKELFDTWDVKNFARIFTVMPSQHRVDFYKILDHKDQIKLLPFLKKDIRQDVIKLSKYDTDSVGSVMSTDFATVISEMNVKSAIKKLREDAPSKKMVYYLYVVDFEMKLIGFVTLKDLVMSNPEKKVKDLLHDNFISAQESEDKENAAQLIEKYDLVALPIVNESNQLVGILRYDDAMDIIRHEETQGMEKFMGIVSNDEDDGSHYAKSSVFHHFKKRVVWIVGLFISSFFSEIVLHKNSYILARFIELSLYLTMITGAGGNVGSQAATVVIRALSLGQVSIKNWFSILFKEVRISILIALSLFVLSYIKVLILSNHTRHISTFAMVVSISLGLQVVFSMVIGASLPLIAKIFKGDPAVAASPAITTLVDIIGMFIYLTVAKLLLL